MRLCIHDTLLRGDSLKKNNFHAFRVFCFSYFRNTASKLSFFPSLPSSALCRRSRECLLASEIHFDKNRKKKERGISINIAQLVDNEGSRNSSAIICDVDTKEAKEGGRSVFYSRSEFMVTISCRGRIGNSSNSSKIFLPDGIFFHQFHTCGAARDVRLIREQGRAIESDSRRERDIP